jgi:hypothetical protein
VRLLLLVVCAGQPECLTHTTLPWLPKDRPRIAMVMRYHWQHIGAKNAFLSHLYRKMIDLPRQDRDEHRKS